MTTVYLYGSLGRKFSHRLQLDVRSPGEAIRALMANFPSFQQYLTTHSAPGYQVFIGRDPIEGPEQLGYPAGQQCIKIVPVIAGASKSPIIGILIGVVIIAAAIALGPTGGVFAGVGFGALSGGVAVSVGLIGASLVIGGISQLLAGTPTAPTTAERPENTPSALFNGPVNTTRQGHPVPIGYGRLRIGSQVISAGIGTMDVAIG